jgi:DNA-binding FadR family transcriptional regulator
MVKTLSRSAVLARELLAAIARGDLQPGDPIDIQALGRQHGVSRTVVREALADLGGKGLVVARPKVGTTVAPASQWNLLDPVLVSVAIAAPDGPGSLLDEALALRGVIEPALAADAARDASRAQRARILAAVRALADAVGAGDRGAQARADETLHEAIADACANRLLRSADRALEPVRALCRTRILTWTDPGGDTPSETVRALELQTALAVAIARGDAATAAARARMLSRLGCPPEAAAPGPAPAPAGVPTARLGSRACDDRSSNRPDTAHLPTGVPSDGGVLRHPVPAGHAPDVARQVFPVSADCIGWPETAMLVQDADPITPLRRAHLDPDRQRRRDDPPTQPAAPGRMPAAAPADR